MKKNEINEHDITKQMLDVMRTPLIKEDEAPSESIELSSSELEDEKKKFMETVDNGTNFEVFKIYPKAENVIFAGDINKKIDWQFSLAEDNGLYVTLNNIKLDGPTFDTLKKLMGYYKNWSDEWKRKVRTEYNNKSKTI